MGLPDDGPRLDRDGQELGEDDQGAGGGGQVCGADQVGDGDGDDHQGHGGVRRHRRQQEVVQGTPEVPCIDPARIIKYVC